MARYQQMIAHPVIDVEDRNENGGGR